MFFESKYTILNHGSVIGGSLNCHSFSGIVNVARSRMILLHPSTLQYLTRINPKLLHPPEINNRVNHTVQTNQKGPKKRGSIFAPKFVRQKILLHVALDSDALFVKSSEEPESDRAEESCVGDVEDDVGHSHDHNRLSRFELSS